MLAAKHPATSLPGALQVPFGEPTTSQYIPVRLTNPAKWDVARCTETKRDIHYGSEKPEVDGSTPSLTTRTHRFTVGPFWFADANCRSQALLRLRRFLH